MYKVYRWVNDMPQELLATYDTLREAYDWARSAATRERKRAKAIRILGPAPSDPRAGRHSQSASSDAPQRQFWYVLNGGSPTKGAILASAVLQRMNSEGAADEAAGLAREPTAPKPGAASNAPQQEAPRGKYCVVREVKGVRLTLVTNLESKVEAQEFIARRKKYERDQEAVYIIVERSSHASSRKGKQPPVGRRARFLRGAPRLRGEVVGSKRERKRPDWEVEDRRSDVSLVARPVEELGLGIPAQWGKGRKSRKGDYIP